jgi:hypothetical protein
MSVMFRSDGQIHYTLFSLWNANRVIPYLPSDGSIFPDRRIFKLQSSG